MTITPSVQWRLPEILVQERITAYTLQRIIGGELSASTVYRLCANRQPHGLTLHAMAWLIYALREATGKDFSPNDLLIYEEG